MARGLPEIPADTKYKVWKMLRPYKDLRFKLTIIPFIRPSVDVEGILKAIIGEDPAPNG